MKVETKVLLINLLIISNVFEGVYWEVIGLSIILWLILRGLTNSEHRVKQWRWIMLFLILWILYVGIQTVYLDLDASKIIRLYGITKTICMPCLTILCFYNVETRKGIINSVLPIIFIICIFGILEFTFGITVLSYRGLNYLGAILVLLFPFVVRELPDEYRRRKKLYFIFLVLITLISGSRAILCALVIAIVYMFFTEKDKRKKSYYILTFMLIVLVLAILIASVGLNYNYDEYRIGSDLRSNIARALTVFTSEGRVDQARTDLKTRALLQFGGFSDIQRWIGSADNRVNIGMVPVHNCFYEVLLCYGIVGEVLFILFLIMQGLIVLKNSINKRYAMIVMAITMLFGFVQPFITTGTLFQIIVGLMLINSMNKKEDYQIIIN